MRKRNDVQKANAFGGEESTLETADAEIFGRSTGTPSLSGDRIVAKPIFLHEITPDPAQPRRVVPSVIRSATAPPHSNVMQHRFDLWARMAFVETAGHQPAGTEQAHTLYRAIIAGEEVERPEKPGPIESAMLRVVDLAASIRARGGLTNPITIWQDGDHYKIETGERRWWAYNLLAYYYAHEQTFKKIPARLVERFDVWRQADENNVRDDLNAVGRARQYAILLLDLVRREQPFEAAHLRPFEAFGTEQDYYKQAAHLRVPRGFGDQLAGAMGLKSRQTVSDYRQLLLLPGEYWVRGDDEGWAVNDLLRIVRSSDISTDDENPTGLDPSTPEEPVSQPTGDLGKVPPTPPTPVPSAEPMHKTVRYEPGQLVETPFGRGTVVKPIPGGLYEVKVNGKHRAFRVDQLSAARDELTKEPIAVGDWVQVPAGFVGKVVGLNGRVVRVQTVNGVREYDNQKLVKVDAPPFERTVIRRDEDDAQVDTSTGEVLNETTDLPTDDAQPQVEFGSLPWQLVQGATPVIHDAGRGELFYVPDRNAREAAQWVVQMANLFGYNSHMEACARALLFAFDAETPHPDWVGQAEALRDWLDQVIPLMRDAAEA